MLKKIFTSGCRVELMKELLFNPKKEFYLSDIARASGTQPIQASKELANLESVGIIKEKVVGKMSFYSINKESPIYPDLKNIFLKTDMLGNFLRNSLKGHDIRYAIIFGSFAAGNERENSDIDLLIVGDVNERILVKTIKKCEENLKREINYILWTRDTFEERAGEKHPLLIDIKKNPVITLIGDENEFRRTVGKGQN